MAKKFLHLTPFITGPRNPLCQDELDQTRHSTALNKIPTVSNLQTDYVSEIPGPVAWNMECFIFPTSIPGDMF